MDLSGPRRLSRRAFLILFPLFPSILMPPAAAAAEAYREYRCTPEVKYECGMAGCEKTGRESLDAESFTYSTQSGEISACLWTNCYAGAATLFRDASSGTITAIARLKPIAHPGNEPITVSLTINDAGMEGRSAAGEKDKREKGEGREESPFTAVWGYGGDRLTFDMGHCAPR
jgi:hypothetical protein